MSKRCCVWGGPVLDAHRRCLACSGTRGHSLVVSVCRTGNTQEYIHLPERVIKKEKGQVAPTQVCVFH